MMKKKITLFLYLFTLFIFNIKAEPIRGVWIPDPSHTSLMHTYKNIKEGVKLFHELNINTLYLCAYAKTTVAFKSEVYKNNSTFTNTTQCYMFAPYMDNYHSPLCSKTGDPVQDLIDEAKLYGIQVIFWFEYGFMATHGVTPASNPLLAKNPHWQSRGNDGKQSNYNGSDYYFNAYHPSMQEFLIKLVEESLDHYPEVAGIQGDDRMPASPRNSGYDSYTESLYQSEHAGLRPPFDYKDSTWTRWRLNILNKFGKNLYERIKSKNPNYLVSFAPNPYPWCLDNLMQDSQSWLKDGIVDILAVQCYRFDAKAYREAVTQSITYAKAVTNKHVVNPGIILKIGEKHMPGDVLEKQILSNRILGTNGEAFFYNEGLLNSEIQCTLKKLYGKPAKH